MNNTIPNVPRELLERAATSIEQRMCIQCEGVPCCMPESLNTLSDIRALLSAPSPAGVDGLEVVGWYRMDDRKAITPYPSVCATWHKMGVKVGAAYSDSAHAIIDGLRGDAERLQMQLAACGVVALANTIESAGEARQMHPDYMSASCSDVAGAVDREIALRTERDHQARRIGELERLLREVRNGLGCENLHHKKSEQHAFDEPCKVLVRIDAALSAGKEGK